LAVAGYVSYQWYFTNDNFMRQIYLVPGNAVYVLQTTDPVKNWKKFSSSKLWQHLKQHPKFEGISKSADAIDKFFNDNQGLLGSIGSREFTMSAHVTKFNDYDFLFIIDLSKASKISILRSSVENVFSNLGYKVTVHKYKDETVYELFDAAYHETLYLSLIANQAVCSYYGALVESAIDEQLNPKIAKENKFIEVEQKTKEGGLARLFINYKFSDEFLRCYLNNLHGVAADLSSVLEFSGLSLGLDNDDIDINGFTNLKDSTDSYLLALLQSGNGNISAYNILPARTAVYTSLGTDNFRNFYDNLVRVLKNDRKVYNEFETNVNKIEKYLKVDLKTNFYSWMGDEVVLSQNTSLLRSAPEYIITIHANDIEKAKENLHYMEEQIKKRTPVKFEATTYKEHEIHYLEVKGLFNVLLGKFFNKIERPYYTIIDDYVCFSNKPETIISLIEDYENKTTLGNDEEFKTFIKRCNEKASVFCYVNGPRYFNAMLSELRGESRITAADNKKYIVCFRNTAFSLLAKDRNFETRLLSNFVIPADSELNAVYTEPKSMNEQDTLSLIERFYVEQFAQGSIMEDYDNGKPKLRAETKDGKKDGKYREYYDDGGIKVKGNYSNGKKDGRWRYYDKDGKLIRKEKYDEGMIQ
jgi:hypothetical protein